jgi:hypothetical protein
MVFLPLVQGEISLLDNAPIELALDFELQDAEAAFHFLEDPYALVSTQKKPGETFAFNNRLYSSLLFNLESPPPERT